MADLCSRLLGDATAYAAEPQAAATDIAQADVALELAVYAADPVTCAAALRTCAQWLRWAQAVYGGDTPQGLRAACAAATVEAWAAEVPTDAGALGAFQRSHLFPFHGVIAALSNDPYTVGPAHAAALDFVAVLGVALVTYASWVWIDYQQAHGGYVPRRQAAYR